MNLTPAQQKDLKHHITSNRGMITVEYSQALLSETDATIDELMLELVPLASEFAVMPVCGFMVGAIVLGETGNLYVGASQDLGNIALSQSVHAEQAAIAVAHHHGETNAVKIAINARPCGHCRQFLYELSGAGQLEILLDDTDCLTLSTLLPDAFGPKELNVIGGLLTPQQHALTLLDATNDELVNHALRAAMLSYAPYTQAFSGAALRTKDGNIFSGSYLENVAFNPSLPAIQSAFVDLVMSGYYYEDVIEAVFVQVKDNIVDQAPAAHMVLGALCPTIHLRVCDAS